MSAAYTLGAQIVLPTVPAGNATVYVALFDVNGNLEEFGQGPVTVVPGQQVPVNITIYPVTNGQISQTGSVAVTITEAPAGTVAQLPVVATPVTTTDISNGPVPIAVTTTNTQAGQLGTLTFTLPNGATTLTQAVNVCGQLSINTSAPVQAATTLILSGSVTGGFYADAACTQPMNPATVPAGAATVSLFYKDSTAGNLQITAIDPSAMWNEGMLNVSITAQ
jgi:hypothetical protein